MIYTVNSPTSSMKKDPKQDSETVSEAYFSENVRLIKEENGWALIETAIDSYQGWAVKSSLSLQKKTASHPCTVTRLKAHVYSKEDTTFGPLLTLPFESKLEILSEKESSSRWIEVRLVDGERAYIQRGDVSLTPSLKHLNDLKTFSLQFLGLPYTWGGRSSFGYDCSGFTQMLYRQAGIPLPRDAKDQANWHGFSDTSLDTLKTGDLLFWGNSQTEIRHVGMYLENLRFIHATVAENAPYIRISYLTDPEWNFQGKWPYRSFKTLNR